MKIKAITEIKTAEEARQKAIEWQAYFSTHSMSYQRIAEWQGYFLTLAKKFNLGEEFKENGII